MHRPIPCACGRLPCVETSIDEHERSVDITCYCCGAGMQESHSSGPEVELSTLHSLAIEGWTKKVTEALRAKADQQADQVTAFLEDIRIAHQVLDTLGLKLDLDNLSVIHRIKLLVEQLLRDARKLADTLMDEDGDVACGPLITESYVPLFRDIDAALNEIGSEQMGPVKGH